MPLVDARGFQLTPDIMGSLGRGAQIGQQFQLGQQQIGAVEAEAAKQQQLQGLLGQLGPGGVMPGQAPQAPGSAMTQAVRPGGREAALAKMAVMFPDDFAKINKNLGAIDEKTERDLSRDAFMIRNAPPEKRPALIQRRVESIRARGGDPSDTMELLGMQEDEQNAYLDAVQIAGLDEKQRTWNPTEDLFACSNGWWKEGNSNIRSKYGRGWTS
jgi:hypothetical protein